MSFVHVKLKGNRCGYVAASEVIEIDPILGELATRDGRRLKLASDEALDRLLGNGLLHGVAEPDGAFVTVPVASIDHVTDRFDEAAGKWIGIAVTQGGMRFAVDAAGRGVLGLDDEIFGADWLQEAVARLAGGDPAAEAAVEAAEEAAGGAPVAKAG